MIATLREAIAAYPIPLREAIGDLSDALTVAQRTRRLLPIERRLRIALARAFRAQGAAFVRGFAGLRYLYEAAGDDDWGPVLESAVLATRELFRQPLLDAVTDALSLGATHFAADLEVGISFTLHNPRVSTYLYEVGGERIVGINETTRAELRKILGKAVDEGWSFRKTARAISAKYADFAGPPLRGGAVHIRSRAELIALTESAHAYEFVKIMMAEEMASRGQPMQKRWVTAARPCPTCAPNPGVGWIALDKSFPSRHAHPPAHPGCRCSGLIQVAPTKVSA